MDQKQRRMIDSERCLEVFHHNTHEFFRRYVTMYETWVHHYEPETKQESMQWVKEGESRAKRSRSATSAGKVLASVFWDSKGIIFIDYLQHGKTINSEYYMRLKDEKREKRPGMQQKKIMFHQDNAPPHRSAVTMAKLDDLHFELLPHPPTRQILLLATFICLRV